MTITYNPDINCYYDDGNKYFQQNNLLMSFRLIELLPMVLAKSQKPHRMELVRSGKSEYLQALPSVNLVWKTLTWNWSLEYCVIVGCHLSMEPNLEYLSHARTQKKVFKGQWQLVSGLQGVNNSWIRNESIFQPLTVKAMKSLRVWKIPLNEGTVHKYRGPWALIKLR